MSPIIKHSTFKNIYKVDVIHTDAIKSPLPPTKLVAKNMLHLVEKKSQRMMTSLETTSKDDRTFDFKEKKKRLKIISNYI